LEISRGNRLIDSTKIISEKVMARMQGYRVFNFPRSGAFNPAEFEKNYRGKAEDFTRKQRECEVIGESPQGQILLAEHHISEVLRTTRYFFNQWYIQGQKSPFETYQDACRIIKNLESSIFNRLSPAFVALDSADPLHTVRVEYKKLRDSFQKGINAVDQTHPNGKGKYAKRLKEYQPIAKEYLDKTEELCRAILVVAFNHQEIDLT
jgi:hypothetical protein